MPKKELIILSLLFFLVAYSPQAFGSDETPSTNTATSTDSITKITELPDLLIRDIQIKQGDKTDNFQLGEVKITIIFKNESNGTYTGKLNTKNNFNNFPDILTMDNNGETILKVYHKNGEYQLQGQDNFKEYYSGRFIKDGSLTLEAEVDYDNLVQESNENNNKFSKTITVGNSIYSPEEKNISTQNRSSLNIKNHNIYSRLKGKIILKVEDAGKAYYIHPQKEEMFYLGRPDDAFAVMREQGIGITTADLNKIPVGLDNLSGPDSDSDGLSDLFEDAIGTNKNKADSDGDSFNDKDELNNGYSPTQKNIKLNYDNNFGEKQKGKILLQVEGKGEAWYVNPENGKRYFLGRPSDAFQVMRNLGLGISNSDFDSM